MRVCMAGNSIEYPAQLWPYLNWALSLRSAGCELVWLETLDGSSESYVAHLVMELRRMLEPFGLADALVVGADDGLALEKVPEGCLPLEAALEADALIDLGYHPPSLVRGFRRSVFVDLDPGQAQIWAAQGEIELDAHTLHVSIGEGVEAPSRPFPDGGLRWRYLPTPVALEAWPFVVNSVPDRPYTTISHWWYEGSLEIDGQWVEVSKQAGFEPFLALPSLVEARLELALGGLDDEDEMRRLQALGWSVRDAAEIIATPWEYRDYVYESRGEFTATKPPYVLLQSGWLNDRTASYLAAGRPAVVQRTIDQRNSCLPDGEGLLRFATVDQAAEAIRAVEADYCRHARSARQVAEEHFDGRKVVTRLLEWLL